MPVILIADDDPAIRTLLRDFLEGQGFSVLTAADGKEALEIARDTPPDLALLDVMMPWVNGLEVIRELRREGDTPVILLTARAHESDKVAGFGLGADDYVTKPFSFHEVEARVRAVLRRAGHAPADVFQAGEVVLDPGCHRVEVRGEPVTLTRAEFAILRAMMEAPGRVFSRANLLGVLGHDHGGSERTVDSHIRNLRSKIEQDPSAPACIETVFGVGYRVADGAR
ncbi:MAG: response regulator transcription factor [Bacteroidota bacterium]